MAMDMGMEYVKTYQQVRLTGATRPVKTVRRHFAEENPLRMCQDARDAGYGCKVVLFLG